MVKIYGIANCDTMKKAFEHLKAKNVAFEFFNYKKEQITAKTIENWLKKQPLEVLLNKNSTTYKELPEANKPQTTEQAVAIMIQKPSIIKRPVVEHGGKLLVGLAAVQASF
jgi:arsenate reductase (glutaredoxin)